MFEKEAEEAIMKKYPSSVQGYKNHITDWKDGAEFGYNKGKAETALLSQHILDLQKDKGNLTDRVRELEQQIEKMKCCYNCKHSRTEYEHCKTDKSEKWEIKEND